MRTLNPSVEVRVLDPQPIIERCYMIHNLFPCPILEHCFDRDFTSQEMNFALLCKKDSHFNQGNATSYNNIVLDSKELKNVKAFAMQGVNLYMKEIISPKDNIEPYITQSWFNYTETNQYHHKHAHPNSFISGVIYFSAVPDKDKIFFYRKEKDYILDLPIKDYNHYNSHAWWMPVSKGMMYLFPSTLPHSVNVVETKETRISLAFNVFLKGDIGSMVNMTYLKL